jgi:hypothetical protein
MDSSCSHQNTTKVLEPKDSMHWAAIVCDDCSKVVRYLPRVSNIGIRKNALALARELLVKTGSPFAKGYLTALLDAERPDGLKLSPKQRDMVSRFKEDCP